MSSTLTSKDKGAGSITYQLGLGDNKITLAKHALDYSDNDFENKDTRVAGTLDLRYKCALEVADEDREDFGITGKLLSLDVTVKTDFGGKSKDSKLSWSVEKPTDDTESQKVLHKLFEKFLEERVSKRGAAFHYGRDLNDRVWFDVFPDRPIKLGDSWKSKLRDDNKRELDGEQKLKLVAPVIRDEKTVWPIEFSSKRSVKWEEMGIAHNCKITSKGRVYFDPRTQKIISIEALTETKDEMSLETEDHIYKCSLLYTLEHTLDLEGK